MSVGIEMVTTPLEPDPTALNTLPASGLVRVRSTSLTAVEVAALIMPNTTAPTAEPPPAAPRTVTTPGAPFTIDNVPGAQVPLAGSASTSKLVIWSRLSLGGPWANIQPFPNIPFKLASTQGTVTVRGTASNWFAFAPHDYQGPPGVGGSGVEAGETHRPVGLIVPTGAAQLQILSVTGSWGHCSGCTSDANGMDPAVLTYAQYWSAAYNSKGLARYSAKFNRLVGLWEYNNAPPPDAADDMSGQQQVDIGAGPINLTPGGAGTPTRFFLAHHDNYEWDNNVGSVDVTFQWV